ncbi:helix-turn-helix domain-containing protein [Actinomadura rupiterrae]|uniref:helix-turn-helix domain-containing protein n=1 Tax=Actinomadura rupiterrae TaxID=559627 RepID=UPI0020A54342|nr:helix-turn-helix transcriptional regulator [Actinomadura rupiterrae]MCP2339193.1 transcriptional regulator with XRE-family HTH domain [Actinomadura rupiterrae]
MNAAERLGHDLQDAITAAGRAQITVAEEIGVSQKHLSQMLIGKAHLSLKWAEKIAEACGRALVVAVVDPDDDLRARLRDAIDRDGFSIETQTDAAMRIVQPVLDRACERTAYLEAKVATLDRLLEGFPDAHADFGHGCADWCFRCQLDRLRDRAERAEAAADRVRELVGTWPATEADAVEPEDWPLYVARREILAALEPVSEEPQ